MESGRAWTPVWSRARNLVSMMQSPATGNQYKNCLLLPGKQNTPESCDSGAVLFVSSAELLVGLVVGHAVQRGQRQSPDLFRRLQALPLCGFDKARLFSQRGNLTFHVCPQFFRAAPAGLPAIPHAPGFLNAGGHARKQRAVFCPVLIGNPSPVGDFKLFFTRSRRKVLRICHDFSLCLQFAGKAARRHFAGRRPSGYQGGGAVCSRWRPSFLRCTLRRRERRRSRLHGGGSGFSMRIRLSGCPPAPHLHPFRPGRCAARHPCGTTSQ